jgi:creatinine amidohydrolase/Fe(II)-dependent formamide hydrolase-like protein|tara:strand:- start:794 stop:1702 length:909 start_codon:yes stop_codon:yes gene_type:complete
MHKATKILTAIVIIALVTGLTTYVFAHQRGARGSMTPEQRRDQQRQQVERMYAMERPIKALNSVWIEELTWMEVRDALVAGKTTAIVSTGGVEQNGPFLATGKHNYVLQGACEGIARKLGNALCAPIIKLVPEGSHDPKSGAMLYSGSISLRQETFEMVLEDVGESLKQHGFEHIIFIGDSGGNQAGMGNAATVLNERWGETRAHYISEFYRYRDVFTYMENELGIVEGDNDGHHDDYVITTIMMATDPKTVRYSQRLAAGLASINGLSIKDKEKSISIGKKLLQFRIDTSVEAIKAVIERP